MTSGQRLEAGEKENRSWNLDLVLVEAEFLFDFIRASTSAALNQWRDEHNELALIATKVLGSIKRDQRIL